MMIIEGQKGQSSSVFNLLIAALVSLAILGLLLSIMGGLDLFGGGQKPQDIASNLLKNAQQNEYQPFTEKITFSKKNPTLTAKALGQKLSVGADNVHFVYCNDLRSIDTSSEFILNYQGTANQDYYLTAICGYQDIDGQAGVPSDCESQNSENFACYLFVRKYVGN